MSESNGNLAILEEVAKILAQALKSTEAPEKVWRAFEAILAEWIDEVSPAAQVEALTALQAALGDFNSESAYQGMVKLTARLTPAEAHILRDALSSLGLLVRQGHDSAALPTSGVELWVAQADHERAIAAIAQLPGTAGDSQVCPQCEEESPANFSSCWNCGTALGT